MTRRIRQHHALLPPEEEKGSECSHRQNVERIRRRRRSRRRGRIIITRRPSQSRRGHSNTSHHLSVSFFLTAAFIITVLISFHYQQRPCYCFSLGRCRTTGRRLSVNTQLPVPSSASSLLPSTSSLSASSSSSGGSRGRKRGKNKSSSNKRRRTSSSSSNGRTGGSSNDSNSRQNRRKGVTTSSPSPVADLFTTPPTSSQSQQPQQQQTQGQELAPVSSLLPPPINRGTSSSKQYPPGRDPTRSNVESMVINNGNGDDNNLQLSSWDDVMVPSEKSGGTVSSTTPATRGSLPSIADLFPPPDLTSPSTTASGTDDKNRNNSQQNQQSGRQTILAPSTIFAGLNGYDDTIQPPPSTMEGAMDIGDIFFNRSRSAKNRNKPANINSNDNVKRDGVGDTNDTGVVGDDEELPFSVEQSDQLSTYHNKMKSRDGSDNTSNNEKIKLHKPKRARRSSSSSSSSPSSSASSPPKSTSSRPRKRAVRRGLEMLVDGVPVSADPPQRAIELYYQYNKTVDWQKVITTNSRDFGPINHYQSENMLSKEELGLFCEYFVDSTLRSNVCPKDLRGLARGFSSKMERSRGKRMVPERGGGSSGGGRSGGGRTSVLFSEHVPDDEAALTLKSIVKMNLAMLEASKSKPSSSSSSSSGRGGRGFGKSNNKDNSKEIVSTAETFGVSPKALSEAFGIELNQSNERLLTRMLTATDETTLDNVFSELMAKDGFSSRSKNRRKGSAHQDDDVMDPTPTSSFTTSPSMEFEFVFSFAVSKAEIEAFDIEGEQPIFERVFMKGLKDATNYTNYEIVFSRLKLVDNGDGTTLVFADFDVVLEDSPGLSLSAAKKELGHIGASLSHSIDEGDASKALATAAMDEMTWPIELRTKLAQEFQLDDVEEDDDDDDDEDGDEYEDVPVGEEKDGEPPSIVDQPTLELSPSIATIDSDEAAVLSLMKDLNSESSGIEAPTNDNDDDWYGGGSIRLNDDAVTIDAVSSGHSSDIFFGGGEDGVFPNYDAGNAANAPYGGKLGLRLVDAAIERAKQRHPRVIAIGDVHGCIDELQELLRECDYRPGDLVVFLGDLVSKGPDSLSVVQLAREIGAIGVRGNHDYEVIRWAQAIKSGIDPPQARSDHYRIATKLSTADMKWMHALPWYIHSHDLEALFVHAGFVSGIRLAKQNPRLMMNMRSILPDGTVTSKFFNNWPWARLWDGPQTVLFGHDADRGLQQYEHAMGLDTGCCYGGRLTACILPEKRLVSVPAKREYFQYRRKHYD